MGLVGFFRVSLESLVLSCLDCAAAAALLLEISSPALHPLLAQRLGGDPALRTFACAEFGRLFELDYRCALTLAVQHSDAFAAEAVLAALAGAQGRQAV